MNPCEIVFIKDTLSILVFLILKNPYFILILHNQTQATKTGTFGLLFPFL